MRRFFLCLAVPALLFPKTAWAQEISQTDWTGGPGTASTTNLTGETGFSTVQGHVLHDAVAGDLLVGQFTWSDATRRSLVTPVRGNDTAVNYYDYQGSGGTPVYPPPVCLESRFFLYREISTATVSWMFHVNINGAPSDPCSGEIDATYAITPAGVATLQFSDETGESMLTGFDHFWINEWSDGHVIEMGGPVWNVNGTIDRVVAVTRHDMFLQSAGARQGFLTFPGMQPQPWTINAQLNHRLESPVFDTGMVRDWGRILNDGTISTASTLQFFVRTGSSVADTTAQAWEGPYNPGDDISSAANSGAQFLQYALAVSLFDLANDPTQPEQLAQLERIQVKFDTDGDDIEDDEETRIGTDPEDADSDDDGIRDGDEPQFDQDTDGDGLINALDPDSDDDGLFDGTEVGNDCNDPATDTTRGNCIPDADAGATTTDPLDRDTDGGGVTDGSEDANLNGVVDGNETDPTSGNGADDSNVVDTDGDGLSDDLETFLGTDPNDQDSDDDGLLDGDEHNPSSDTDGDGLINPLDVDSDNDALFDGTEEGQDCNHPDTDTTLGHCRPDADSGATETFSLVADSDGGGESDGSEDCNLDGAVNGSETDPGNPADDNTNVDTDGDGLSDCLEVTIGSDPNDGDSDDDGLLDGDEANPSDDHDGDGLVNIIDEDSDGDGLFDGTEVGNDCNDADTDTTVGNCIPDADLGATTTNHLDEDTDDGGVNDGDEDTNKNGVIDPGERDPNDPSDDGMTSGAGGAGGAGGAAGGGTAAGGNASSGAGGDTGSTGSGTAADDIVSAIGGCGCGVDRERDDDAMWITSLLLAAWAIRRRRRSRQS